MMRASVQYLLSRDIGSGYCETARIALEAAKRTGDARLVSQALFECARAAGEEGATDLFIAAEAGANELTAKVDPKAVPMAVLAKAYCRFLLGDPGEARINLRNALQISQPNANAAELALIHSGLGISSYFLGDFEESYQEYLTALELTRRVGDDARLCTIAANLCGVLMNRGKYEEALRYGKLSVKHGEACSSSYLLVAYTNLIDPYMLLGREAAAMDCLERAKKWIEPDRRWRLRLQFLSEAASFALMQRNVALAIDLINQLEGVSKGREIAIPMAGTYWKLRAFRMATLGQLDAAYKMVSWKADSWKDSMVFGYLDMIATKAWLEKLLEGRTNPETVSELEIFGRLGAVGKRQLLVLQGFLEASVDVRSSNTASSLKQKMH